MVITPKNQWAVPLSTNLRGSVFLLTPSVLSRHPASELHCASVCWGAARLKPCGADLRSSFWHWGGQAGPGEQGWFLRFKREPQPAGQGEKTGCKKRVKKMAQVEFLHSQEAP